MTHAAKRITNGTYEYRGHTIVRVEYDRIGCTPAGTVWDVHLGEQLVDAADTLRDAKWGIDYYLSP